MDSSPERRLDVHRNDEHMEGQKNPLNNPRGRKRHGIVDRSICERIDG